VLTRFFIAVMALVAIAAGASAQDYPNRPIRIIVPFPPGGNSDSVARLLGQEMTKGLGQPVVVDNKPGAGGSIGADLVAKGSADGYTLLLVTGGHAVLGAVYKTLPYQTVDDFAWISTATLFPFVVTTRADAKFKNLTELIAAAKANPANVVYGAPGVGATQHLTTELLASMAGVKFLSVPYRGEGPAVTAILSNEIQMLISAATAVKQHVDAGTLRPIAVTSASRWNGMPDVPTVAEAGVPGFDVSSWAGLATTRGTPSAIVQRLNAEVQKALAVREVRSRLEGFGGTVTGSTPAELHDRVATELARWTTVVRDANIEQQ
jgi:tripartite-type tricarboxylate transporter receptor subunit TctC